jgi:short subunit dehydrogenase-like uncharacterized protein
LEPLEELAQELSAAEIESIALDVTDPAAVRAAAGKTRLVLTTVGPFVRFGATVLDACLDQATN